MAINTKIATSSLPGASTASTFYMLCKKWGAPCPFCIYSAPSPSPFESKWSDKDWNGIRHKQREEKKKEQQEKEEAEKKNKEESAQKDYYPASPMYDPNFKEDTIPAPIEMKQDLDPYYYPLNCVPNYREDAPTLMDSLVAPPAKTKEENKGEDTKEENKGEDTKEEDRGEGKRYKTQIEEDSGQNMDKDDYSDYSDSDYISDYIY